MKNYFLSDKTSHRHGVISRWTIFGLTLVGNISVLLILRCYALLPLEKLKNTQLAYSAFNAINAISILASLAFTFNLWSFIIDVYWLIISFFSLFKALKQRAKADIK